MSQLIDQIRTAYGYSFDSLKAYDHGVNEYPAARMFLQTDDPLAGTFLAYQLATYPTPSGRATLSASDGSRKASYSAMDLTNGLVIEGQYQAFWGIQDVATQNNLTYVPFALLTEGIVTLGGVPKYRAMQSLTGRIYRNRVVVNGIDITPRILMLSGAYEAVNVETFDSTDSRVPCLFGACRLSYQAVWLKQ